ncbi:MAG: gamma-glutamylcyclotransferase family protein [Novosphingobium sp.]|uniref:gamma-glutamylcyclotransferase family protein n=1 Tax=Novosphingobium sp. TaxID=1874826 RepID=UPI0030195663
MRQPRRLFFYGTLTHHHDNALTSALLPRLGGRARRGWVPGALFLVADPLGVYPVLMPGRGRVWGWVYGGLRPVPRAVIAAFDAWEGSDPRRPGRGEYRRADLLVRTPGGPLRAAAYLPNRRSCTGLRRVPGGDFARHAAARGLRVLAE